MQSTSPVDPILIDLRSPDPAIRARTFDRLKDLSEKGIALQDGRLLLRAATESFPPPKWEWQETNESLVKALWGNERAEYVDDVLKVYPLLTEKARAAALGVLNAIVEATAAEAFVSLMAQWGPPSTVYPRMFGTLAREPRHSAILFPDLIRHVASHEYVWAVLDLAVRFFRAGALEVQRLVPVLPVLLTHYRAKSRKLMRKQRLEGVDWMWTDSYKLLRYEVGTYLDLMGYLDTAEVRVSLIEALKFNDPYIRHYAAISLLRLGQEVDPAHFDFVARSAEMRNELYEKLVELGRESLYPHRYCTQEAFAESCLVGWMTYPSELGRVPDEIELGKIVSVDPGSDQGVLDFYVFKFRVVGRHWARKKGWMAGVAGPFPRIDSPTTKAMGHTFSQFKSWESETPEGHVGEIEAMMDAVSATHPSRRN